MRECELRILMVNEVLKLFCWIINKLWKNEMEKPELTDAAKRALAEAETRRKTAEATKLPREVGGGKGLEPTRFGDWEKKGITSDF